MNAYIIQDVIITEAKVNKSKVVHIDFVIVCLEFEQFLAQRSQDVQQRPRPQMQKQEEDDGLFAL